MRCCEAWKPIEKCFDPISFECDDFPQAWSDYCESYRENLAEREAEVTNLPWTQTEKGDALAKCGIGQRAWRTKKTSASVSALTLIKRAIHLKTKINQVEGFVSIGDPFSKHVSKARDITSARISYDMFGRLLTTSVGPLIGPSLTSSLPWWKILHLAPMEFHMALTDVRGDWAHSSFLTLASICWKEEPFQNISLKVGRSLSPRLLTSMTMEEFATVIANFLFLHLSRAPLVHHEMHTSFVEMYLFQAHDRQHLWDRDHSSGSYCACSARFRCPVDGLCCCLSQRQSCLDPPCDREDWTAWFYQPLPAKFFYDCTTHVEFAGTTGWQFLMAGGVRQGCPASGFLFAMDFDPIFRWLQETIIPRNPDNLHFLQPTQFAYADDLAVAASSFRGLMTALAPAFRSVDHTAGLYLTYRKCCWPQYGTEGRESLWHWLSESCEEFREMKIVRHAKYVGTMIGPDGHIHRWSAHRKKSSSACWKSMRLPKAWLSDCAISRSMRFLYWVFIGPACAPDKATLKAENHALQCTTAGPYNAIPSNLLGVGSVCGLGPDLVGIRSISLAARYRVAACSTTLSQGLDEIQTARGHNCAPIFALSPVWEKEFLAPSMACSTADAFDIVCRLDRNGTLDEAPQNKKQNVATGLLLHKLHEQDFAGPISLRASKVLGPISRHRVADILHHMKLVSRASRPGLTFGVLRILCNGLCTALRFHTE